jgi:hypothetical protein
MGVPDKTDLVSQAPRLSYARSMARRRRLEPSASSRILRRFLGVPPAPGASREERLLYVRRCALLSLPSVALVWVVALGFGHFPGWLLIVVGVSTILGLGNVASLSYRIRRARSQ